MGNILVLTLEVVKNGMKNTETEFKKEQSQYKLYWEILNSSSKIPSFQSTVGVKMVSPSYFTPLVSYVSFTGI